MRSNTNIVFCACIVSIFCSSQVSAEGVEFSGNVRVGVLNTDNVFLVTTPDEVEETVYQVSPSLNLDYENQRINASVRYQFDWYDYSDLDSSNEYHRYDATLTGELVPDTLFLEIGASRSQSVVDPDALIPSGGLPISSNLADRDEYYISPKFQKTLGRSVTVLLNYRLAEVRHDDSDFEDTQFIQDNTNESATFKIENYKKGEGLTWAAGYDWQETDYDQSLPWEHQKATVELGFWANGSTRIFASGGKESAWDDPIDRSLQDKFWEAGFSYKSGDKMSAEFAAGERSFGSSWRGKLNLSFQRGELVFSYAETPTTTGLNRYSRGNLLNPEEPNDFLTQLGRAERYISERGQASLTLKFRRTSLGFVAYDEVRTGRFRADGTALGDQTQQGVSLSFSWQLGVRTELAASGSINNRETESGNEQDFMTGAISVSYRIGSSIGLSLGYNYSEQDPTAGSSGRDYVANVASLFLTYSF